jgi:membrane protein required for colicin V production
MNILDVLLILFLMVFALLGAWRGAVREIFSVLAWILGVVCAWLYAERFADAFASKNDLLLGQIIAFLVVFAATFITVALTGFIVRKFLLSAELGNGDRFVGSLVGVLRGLVLTVVMVLVAGITSLPGRAWWQESVLMPYVQPLAERARGLLPGEAGRHIRYERPA